MPVYAERLKLMLVSDFVSSIDLGQEVHNEESKNNCHENSLL